MQRLLRADRPLGVPVLSRRAECATFGECAALSSEIRSELAAERRFIRRPWTQTDLDALALFEGLPLRVTAFLVICQGRRGGFGFVGSTVVAVPLRSRGKGGPRTPQDLVSVTNALSGALPKNFRSASLAA